MRLEILGFVKDEQMRKHLPKMVSFRKCVRIIDFFICRTNFLKESCDQTTHKLQKISNVFLYCSQIPFSSEIYALSNRNAIRKRTLRSDSACISERNAVRKRTNFLYEICAKHIEKQCVNHEFAKISKGNLRAFLIEENCGQNRKH